MEDDLEEEFRDLIKQKERLLKRSQGTSRLNELSKVLNRLGEILYQMGHYQESLEEHKAEEAACAAINDTVGVAIANRKIGECYAELCNHEKALLHQTKHLELARDLQNDVEEQRALATIGRTHLYHAEALRVLVKRGLGKEDAVVDALNKAEEAFYKSLDVCARITSSQVGALGLVQMKARLYLNLGLVIEQRGNLKDCVHFVEKAIALHREHSQWEDLERCHHSLALIYQKHEDFESSLHQASKSLEASKKLNDVKLQCEILMLMGRVHLQESRYNESKRALRKARKMMTLAGLEEKEVVRLLKIAVRLQLERDALCTSSGSDVETRRKVYEKMGDLYSRGAMYVNAINCYKEALHCAEEMNLPKKDLAPLYLSLAQTYVDCEMYDRASHFYDLEMDCWEENPEERCRTLLNLADCKERLGESYASLENLYLESLELAKAAGNPHLEKRCLESLSTVQETFGEFQKRSKTLKAIADINVDQWSSEEGEDEISSSSGESSLLLSESSPSDASETEVVNMVQRVHCPKTRRTFRLRKNEKGETPLHRACIAGDVKQVKRLLEQGHPVNVGDNIGWFPLHEAANHGYPEIVNLLLENGAKVNCPCEGLTPLHDAACNGNHEVVRILLRHGASLTAKTNKGETALDCLVAWIKRASAEGGDSENIEEGSLLADELRALMERQNKSVDGRTYDEDHLFDDAERVAVPKRHNRNSESRKTRTSGGSTSFSGRGDSSDDGLGPALVEEGHVLPANENWLIDDVGDAKHHRRETKRRRRDLLSWVEGGNVLRRSPGRSGVGNHPANSSHGGAERGDETRRKRRHDSGDGGSSLSPEDSGQQNDLDVPVVAATVLLPPVSSVMKIKVKILDTLLLIPVPWGESISWLCKEAAQRYFTMTGLRPVLNLSTKEGAILSPDDSVDVVLSPGEEVVGALLSWDLAPISERYVEACTSLGVEPYDDVRQILAKAETSLVATFTNLTLSSTSSQAVFRTLQCQFTLRELVLSGIRLRNQSLQTLGLALQKLPGLRSLDVSSNDLSDSCLGQLVQPLARPRVTLPIENLILDFNPLLEDGCLNLIEFLQCLPNLTSLSLRSVCLEADAAFRPPHLSEALSVVAGKIEHLDLSFTRLAIEQRHRAFSTVLGPSILSLNLTAGMCRRSSGISCRHLSICLGKDSCRLRQLNLSHCVLDDDAVDELLRGLSDKRNLDLVDLSANPALTPRATAAFAKTLPLCKVLVNNTTSDVDPWTAMLPDQT